MTTLKVRFRESTVATKPGTIYYQIIHCRLVRQINPGYKLFPSEWEKLRSVIILSNQCDNRPRNPLESMRARIEGDLKRIKNIIMKLQNENNVYTADDIVRLYRTSFREVCFISHARNLVAQLHELEHHRTAERYTTVINSFKRFLGDNDLPLEDMDSELMVKYEHFLSKKGLCANTTSYYIRGLRAIYNRAIDKGLISPQNIFRHVYTGIDKTVKRALPLKVIRRISEMDLSDSPAMDFARDLFMFSFYTRGMPFVDMAFLKKSALKNGILTYRRQKTGQKLLIKWERPMQRIVDKYKTSDNPYMLPIIKQPGFDERRQYKSAAHFVNNKLKKLGTILGLSVPLTSYVARHSWASIAKSKDVPISTISEAMGHDSERTTRIYLSTLDTSSIDKANSMILKLLQ